MNGLLVSGIVLGLIRMFEPRFGTLLSLKFRTYLTFGNKEESNKLVLKGDKGIEKING